MISSKSRKARRARARCTTLRPTERTLRSSCGTTAWALGVGLMLLLVGGIGRAENAPEVGAEAEGPSEGMEEILVKGQVPSAPDVFVVSPERATPNAPDASQLMKLVPGGAVANNGPLAGQVQYRGMSGDRVSVRIDDAFITSGGPNMMDPPLHYAPRVLLDHLEVTRGIAAVSEGPETIGGSVQSYLKTSEFGEESRFRPLADVELSGRTVDGSVAGGGIVGVANDMHRFHVLGSAEAGTDMKVPGGRVIPTLFERYQYGAGYGLRMGEHELGLDYRYNDTLDTGNPALPMDTRFVKTNLGQADYHGTVGVVTLDGLFSGSDVNHRMDNFGLRTPPPPARFRQADATAEAYGYALSGSASVLWGDLGLGTDGHLARHDMEVTNPNNAAFFVINFNDVKRDRYSFFAEWESDLSDLWSLEAGLRYTFVPTNAGEVDALPAQLLPPAMRLRDAFNSADRSRTDHLLDAVATLAIEPWEGWRFELAGARKTRAPTYLERYSWIPLEVTGGLADGNNYVGQIDLEKEVAYEIEGGVEWRWRGLYLAPRAFYRRVNGYIQGVPSTDPDVIAVSTLNGDPTPLVFSNVYADLYGIDSPYALELPFHFQIDGVVSYTRGKRRDIRDNLYRIAPVNGRTSLSYLRDT